MKLVADLHIHSKYARATSPRSDLETLEQFALLKGVNVLGTGDFTYPLWFKELSKKLEPAQAGMYTLASSKAKEKVRFIPSVEVSLIYKKGSKTRKIHHVIVVPSLKEVEAINKELMKVGNVESDGRPIFGLSSERLAEIVFGSSERAMLIPAHAWTPWFGVFGSKSGFDSLEECFEKWTPRIFAIETGLSSDPAMNWMLSQLDNIAIISNSDCHSPEKIMREANVLVGEMSYASIYDAFKTRDPKKFLYTIEFFPEEGKYHLDGHREHRYSITPEQTKKFRGICPIDGKPLTIGVLHRVNDLADRKEGEKPIHTIPYKSFIPLQEIIEQVKHSKGRVSKELYAALVHSFGNELIVLESAVYSDLVKAGGEDIAQAIMDVRAGKVKIIPGYDGEFGKIEVLGGTIPEKQHKLF